MIPQWALGCIINHKRVYSVLTHRWHGTSRPMCINKEKLCHGILSHVAKHNKLHDLSDSNGHFQNILSIYFNSHLKRQQLRSIYHIKTIVVLDSIDFKSCVSLCTTFPNISCYQLPGYHDCAWLRAVLTANHNQCRHSRCMLIMRLECT